MTSSKLRKLKSSLFVQGLFGRTNSFCFTSSQLRNSGADAQEKLTVLHFIEQCIVLTFLSYSSFELC